MCLVLAFAVTSNKTMLKPLMEVLSIGFSCYGEYIGNLGLISFGELLNLMPVWLGWASDENLCLNNIN